MMSDSEGDIENTQQEQDKGKQVDSEEDRVYDSQVVPPSDANSTSSVPPPPVVIEKSPLEIAIKLKEDMLEQEVMSLESRLRSERLSLSRARDKISETGKNGYFILQAQVAEFLKKKDVEQKDKVVENKREFIFKMLPVIDAFKSASITAPATTDREQKMHDSYGALLKGIMIVFDKYGYKEYNVDVGSKYDAERHQVDKVVDGEVDGLVVSQVRNGVIDSEGDVLRKALVTISKVPAPAPTHPEAQPLVVDEVGVKNGEEEKVEDKSESKDESDKQV